MNEWPAARAVDTRRQRDCHDPVVMAVDCAGPRRAVNMQSRTVGLCLAFVLAFSFTTPVAANESWLPLSDIDLAVPGGGNALDFSALLQPGPAGRNGWAVALPEGRIGFENRRVNQRFLCASMLFSGLNGGVPDKAGADRWVEQLQRTGYGLVRLHFVDAHLMTGRDKDFDFDPVQLDRLHYLMSRMKAAGIYWIVDGMTSDNGGHGAVYPHRYVRKYTGKLDALLGGAGFDHWARLVERLWGARNPYTGMAPLADPAMLGMILVNEGGVAFQATVHGERYPEMLAAPFQAWLQKRYPDADALRKAWGTELRSGEARDGAVAIPDKVRGQSPRDTDFARFIADLERDAYRAMDAHVRQLGFRGLTTAYDNWGFFNHEVSRSALGWVDMHAYHALPSVFGQPGSKLAQTSVHVNVARFARELTNSRQWGKPFTVTEYGQPFWNQWRHEAAALIPAMAAHQGWDAICQFAESPLQDDYGASPFKRRQAIYPMGTGADPIARSGERLAAMLFLRGDVSPSPGKIRLRIDADAAFKRNGGWEQVPEGLSRLSLVTAVGLDFSPTAPVARAGELVVDLTSPRPAWLSRVESALVAGGIDSLAAGVGPLKDAGIVAAGNRSRPQDRLYQSDTGQMTVDSTANTIVIDTPRTAVLVVRGGAAEAGALELRDVSGPALFALSALDGQPLVSSRRMLLWVLTDAINTGMSFDDVERTTLRTIGRFPPMVRTVSATVRVAAGGAGTVDVYPLSLAGTRRAVLPMPRIKQAAELRLDTSALPDGPALLYEIIVN